MTPKVNPGLHMHMRACTAIYPSTLLHIQWLLSHKQNTQRKIKTLKEGKLLDILEEFLKLKVPFKVDINTIWAVYEFSEIASKQNYYHDFPMCFEPALLLRTRLYESALLLLHRSLLKKRQNTSEFAFVNSVWCSLNPASKKTPKPKVGFRSLHCSVEVATCFLPLI